MDGEEAARNLVVAHRQTTDANPSGFARNNPPGSDFDSGGQAEWRLPPRPPPNLEITDCDFKLVTS
jgi:hypothetical protein